MKHFSQASLKERESVYKEHTIYCAFIFQELSSLANAVILHSPLLTRKCWLKVAAGMRLNRLFIMTDKFQMEHRKR